MSMTYSLASIMPKGKPLAVISNNRISVPLQGRIYPFITPQETLPDFFGSMPAKIYTTNFPLPKSGTKSELFRWYADGITKLGDMRVGFNYLCASVAVAGGFKDPYRMLDFKRPPAGTAELAALPPAEIARLMDEALKTSVVKFVFEMVQTLDDMVNKQHAGIIDWTCADAYRYHYFIFNDNVTVLDARTKRDERVDGFKHTVTTTIHTDKERYVSLTRHVHDLIDAKSVTLGDYVGRAPERVIPVFRATDPTWLKPFCRVVDGQQIRDLRIEREISREKWTDIETNVTTWEETPPVIREEPHFRYDPAIVIGHYVLVGWNGDEVTRQHSNATKNVTGARKQCPLCNGSKKWSGQTCNMCHGTGGVPNS
jgi:uncharacterized protein (UPF0218 family)